MAATPFLKTFAEAKAEPRQEAFSCPRTNRHQQREQLDIRYGQNTKGVGLQPSETAGGHRASECQGGCAAADG
ncbi:hypothetical protein [Candidatus Accumulibacter aalborgensis]|uniref:hypothetical protein n=1 Tax=Candidatus Accumulibacter aalborgensis TaxID=1860102 RepID=UPI00164435A1|nr:hypothetical protein [Candidatus Accumulibacter aalborgensis]